MGKREGICFWGAVGLLFLGAVGTVSTFKISSVSGDKKDSGVQIKSGGDDETVEWLSLDYDSYENLDDSEREEPQPWKQALSVFGREKGTGKKNETQQLVDNSTWYIDFDWGHDEEYDWEEDVSSTGNKLKPAPLAVVNGNSLDSTESKETYDDDNGWWGSSNDNDSLQENNTRFGLVLPSKKGTS